MSQRIPEDASLEPLEYSNSTRESVGKWLDQMGNGLHGGRFRYCRRGSLVPARTRAAHFVTCFAMKIAWTTGLWKSWPDDRRRACVSFVRSFQREDGRFVDRGIMRRIVLGRVASAVLHRKPGYLIGHRAAISEAIRAETRQSASTLLMVESPLAYPVPAPWQTVEHVVRFMEGLPWSEPWAAGSHASHLVFGLHINSLRFPGKESTNELLDTAFREIEKRRIPSSGTWGLGNVSPKMQLNGAMKLLTAYKWTERPFEYATELIDFALDQSIEYRGCEFLNRLFVLRECSRRVPDYRGEDIREVAMDCLCKSSAFAKPDGAFSYSAARTQRNYYGAYTSLGGRQSDIHGTTMLTWAIALCLDLLGCLKDSGWDCFTP